MRQGELTMEIAAPRQNLYSTVQQEVDLGAQALRRENADMAITLFQSAIQKLTVQQPFYDHLVHNLLNSYILLIKQSFQAGDTAAATSLLRPALNLEIVYNATGRTLDGSIRPVGRDKTSVRGGT